MYPSNRPDLASNAYYLFLSMANYFVVKIDCPSFLPKETRNKHHLYTNYLDNWFRKEAQLRQKIIIFKILQLCICFQLIRIWLNFYQRLTSCLYGKRPSTDWLCLCLLLVVKTFTTNWQHCIVDINPVIRQS